MRRKLASVLRGRSRRYIDIIAVAIVLGYAFLAFSSQSGASVGGHGLDPVWAAAKRRGTLRVAVDFGFYPFSGFDDNNQPIGYDIDLARAVAQKLGLTVEFVPTSIDSIYDVLADRKADMAASALTYAPQQGWRVNFSTFYFNAGQVLVVPEKSPITRQDQLHNIRLGTPLGSDADAYARKLIIGNTSISLHSEYDTPGEVLADLRVGRLDAAIVDNASALSDIGHYGGLRVINPALTLEPYALAMPAQAYQLHDLINNALKDLQDQGFFEKNGKRWFVEEPLPTPSP